MAGRAQACWVIATSTAISTARLIFLGGLTSRESGGHVQYNCEEALMKTSIAGVSVDGALDSKLEAIARAIYRRLALSIDPIVPSTARSVWVAPESAILSGRS
jgi:hypothetical protein